MFHNAMVNDGLKLYVLKNAKTGKYHTGGTLGSHLIRWDRGPHGYTLNGLKSMLGQTRSYSQSYFYNKDQEEWFVLEFSALGIRIAYKVTKDYRLQPVVKCCSQCG